jgi:hypothetical protein
MMHLPQQKHGDLAHQMELPYIAPSYARCTDEEAW